jgi:hypothetical protein
MLSEPDDLITYELERLRIEAGFCRICGASLFKKSSVTDGLGQLCMDCSRKKGGGRA